MSGSSSSSSKRSSSPVPPLRPCLLLSDCFPRRPPPPPPGSHVGESSSPHGRATTLPPPPGFPLQELHELPEGRITDVRFYDARRERGLPMTDFVEAIEEKIKQFRLLLGLAEEPEERPLLEPPADEGLGFLDDDSDSSFYYSSSD